jgi:hypothetical protein
LRGVIFRAKDYFDPFSRLVVAVWPQDVSGRADLTPDRHGLRVVGSHLDDGVFREVARKTIGAPTWPEAPPLMVASQRDSGIVTSAAGQVFGLSTRGLKIEEIGINATWRGVVAADSKGLVSASRFNGTIERGIAELRRR